MVQLEAILHGLGNPPALLEPGRQFALIEEKKKRERGWGWVKGKELQGGPGNSVARQRSPECPDQEPQT